MALPIRIVYSVICCLLIAAGVYQIWIERFFLVRSHRRPIQKIRIARSHLFILLFSAAGGVCVEQASKIGGLQYYTPRLAVATFSCILISNICVLLTFPVNDAVYAGSLWLLALREWIFDISTLCSTCC